MIKKIIKALKANSAVSKWLIIDKQTNTHEAYYVLGALETTRMSEVHEYQVVVYKNFAENNQNYLGSSSFIVSHNLRSSELTTLIEEALYRATFVKNKVYDLVKGTKKRVWKMATSFENIFDIIGEMANIFTSQTTSNVKFNALEIFYTQTITHVVNSEAVDYQKCGDSIMVEAIPSYDGAEQKVELYKDFRYDHFDPAMVLKDAQEALKEVTYRYQAQKAPAIQSIDVVLGGKNVVEFFGELIKYYDYASVYQKMSSKKIGDSIQEEATGELLTIGLKKASKIDNFDQDGVLLKPVTIIEQGKIINYFGSNRFAQYLNIEPVGILSMLDVKKGSKSITTLKKKPHIEILSLSGLQIDLECGYIGGEVRLALYYDGKTTTPISGFSFSGSLQNCLKHLYLSKETQTLAKYSGPQMILLPKMEIL